MNQKAQHTIKKAHLKCAFLVFFTYIEFMKQTFFKTLAKLNKAVLPSFTKRALDITKASKFQLLIIGWRAFVTMHSLD